jgi:hypothetical protein
MRLVAAAIAVAIGAALLAYGGTPPVRAAASCPVSQVRYDAYGGGDHSRYRIPWLAARPAGSGLAAMLWYWPSEWTRARRRGAAIYTGGEMPQGWSTKVLWTWVGPAQRGRGGRRLTVRGTRLDAHGSFTQRFGAISYGGQDRAPSFASIINVPSTGCWRLDASTAELRASVVVRALRAPAPR